MYILYIFFIDYILRALTDELRAVPTPHDAKLPAL